MREISSEELSGILKKHEQWLQDEGKGERANLSAVNLSGLNLDGANLQCANLQGANLQYAYLKGANLSYSNLRKANLSHTCLKGADLSHAYLKNAILHDVNLQSVKLEGAYGEQDTERRIKKMTNYGYIKTLSQDELVTFIMNDMTMASNDILDESIRCWSDDEQSSTELEMWKNWLNKQHEEKY